MILKWRNRKKKIHTTKTDVGKKLCYQEGAYTKKHIVIRVNKIS